MSGGETILAPEILAELEKRGLSQEKVRAQLAMLKKGVPFADLVRPCTVGDGIVSIEGKVEELASYYADASASLEIVKFVPASGAATRMFKELAAAVVKCTPADRKDLEKAAAVGDGDAASAMEFVDKVKKFAFYDELAAALKKDGLDPDGLLEAGGYGPFIVYTLDRRGLNYSNLPKGIIKFHSYPDRSRTAFEEHLVEAVLYARGDDGKARVHFTLSPEHVEIVGAYIAGVKELYEGGAAEIVVGYSVQSPSTDTIAAAVDGGPFLDDAGKPVFRPGGHGALIGNLGALGADVAFVKNVDNVVPDRLKPGTVLYKRALGGYLLRIREILFSAIEAAGQGGKGKVIEDVLRRLSDMGLHIDIPGGAGSKRILEILRRPIRVAGVVRNTGEPGGGPFIVRRADGKLSLQIVESAQVDMKSDEQKAVWESSTHFNPVDIVCALTDETGKPYDLSRFVDHEAGFVSVKSSGGRELKALELPGLWNGGMAFWHTVFVEVPGETFNPVKTVFDLLRPEHQPG